MLTDRSMCWPSRVETPRSSWRMVYTGGVSGSVSRCLKCRANSADKLVPGREICRAMSIIAGLRSNGCSLSTAIRPNPIGAVSTRIRLSCSFSNTRRDCATAGASNRHLTSSNTSQVTRMIRAEVSAVTAICGATPLAICCHDWAYTSVQEVSPSGQPLRTWPCR